MEHCIKGIKIFGYLLSVNPIKSCVIFFWIAIVFRRPWFIIEYASSGIYAQHYFV
jgi:hypothetical protein